MGVRHLAYRCGPPAGVWLRRCLTLPCAATATCKRCLTPCGSQTPGIPVRLVGRTLAPKVPDTDERSNRRMHTVSDTLWESDTWHTGAVRWQVSGSEGA